MATANFAPAAHEEAVHPALAYFSPAERERMQKEDTLAFSIVSAELVAIVSLGFVLVGITLCAIVFYT